MKSFPILKPEGYLKRPNSIELHGQKAYCVNYEGASELLLIVNEMKLVPSINTWAKAQIKSRKLCSWFCQHFIRPSLNFSHLFYVITNFALNEDSWKKKTVKRQKRFCNCNLNNNQNNMLCPFQIQKSEFCHSLHSITSSEHSANNHSDIYLFYILFSLTLC